MKKDIRWILYCNQLKQKELCEIVDISPPTLSCWTKKEKSPNLLIALKLYYMSGRTLKLEDLLSDDDKLEYDKFKRVCKKKISMKKRE